MNTSNKRLAAGMSILLMAALACTAPIIGEDTPEPDDPYQPSAPSNLGNVSVAPTAGSGQFSVSVSYFWRLGDSSYTITCSYPDAQGNNTSSVLPLDHQGNSAAFSIYVTKPGVYEVLCQDTHSGADKAEFKVIEKAPSTNTPDGFFELPKLGQFSSGGMWFYFDQATSSVPGFFLAHCLPGVNYTSAGGSSNFTVAPDGKLTGECDLTYYNNAERLASTLTQGQWLEDGTVTFRLETMMVYDNVDEKTGVVRGTSTYTMIWTGSGKFTSATTASGTATWTGTCQTNNIEAVLCISRDHGTYVAANGTVPWVINFSP